MAKKRKLLPGSAKVGTRKSKTTKGRKVTWEKKKRGGAFGAWKIIKNERARASSRKNGP